ncbi:hypothetical protein ACFLRO_01280 [Bacteroidota bacterium]
MRLIRLTLVLASYIVAGCSEDPVGHLESDEHVVFGDFYGECLGEGCIDIFKIQDGRVFADTLDRYPSASMLPHETAWVEISDDSFTSLCQIFSEIPTDLFLEEEIVIGQPDAGDWGGFYLETRLDDETRYWLIDKLEGNLPSYLRPFAERLDEAIRLAGESAPQ